MTLTDDAARVAIRTQLDRTFLIEAAAGTGKSTSLISRMVSLVRTGTSRVETIAAITFTVKAAAQLRERFQEGLEGARRESSGDQRARLDAALQTIERCFIGTTHAFCARLLRERPVEADLDPEFQENDQVQALLQTNDFWNRYVERVSARGGPVLEQIQESGIELRSLREGFIKLVDFPDVEIVSVRVPRPDLSRVYRDLSQILDDIEPHMPGVEDGHKPDDFEILIRKLLRKRHRLDVADPSEIFDFLDEANHKSARPVQKNWPDKPQAKSLGLRYAELVEMELRPALTRWREHSHEVALDILRPALEEFADERRRTGKLSFQDLLMCARDLLRDHPHVRAYFQRRFTHLLVDEFQDTDPVQAEVMFLLTGVDVHEKEWRKLSPRAGSLFIVGDPKQSIYRFRRADITTYLQVKERIVASGGEELSLSSNFRSNQVVCDWVNESVGPLFDAAAVESGRQAAYSSLAATREAVSLSGIYHLESTGQNVGDVAASEAACLAKWIRRAVDAGIEIEDDGITRGLEWRDVMLVSAARSRLDVYAEALERAGIPTEVSGSRAFTSGEELAALLALLRAVIDPDDQVSLVAFLRGPFCGVDDQTLYDFVVEGGRFSWLREPQPADALDERIERAFAMLRETWRESREHPPAATIARVVERLGIVAHVAAGERGGTRSGNLLKVLSIARTASAEGASLAAVVGLLESTQDDDSDIAEMDIDPSAENAVRVMNLHQVKGLEAAVVFLVDPSSPRRIDPRLYIDRSSDPSKGYFTLSREFGKSMKIVAQPPGWDGMAAGETQFESAERVRHLYVAATRAKNMLVVGSQPSPKGPKGVWSRLASRISERFPMPDDPVDAAASEVSELREGAETLSFEKARESIAAGFGRAAATTYSVVPVTKIAHADHAQLVKVEEGLGRGMSWGRVLHRLLEAMLKDQTLDMRSFAENLLKDEEREPAEIDDVLRTIEALQQSALWKRVLRAEQRMVEVPFAVMSPAKDLGLPDDGNTLLHGAIDLVFFDDGLWHIVDYKTDSIKGAGRLESLVEYYTPQVREYVRFWTRITGQPAEGGLFFVDGPVEIWL